MSYLPLKNPKINLPSTVEKRFLISGSKIEPKQYCFGYGYRIGYQQNFLWIWIPDLIPKKCFLDLDTGSDSKTYFYGSGCRIGYQEKFFWIWILDWIPTKFFWYLDTGLNTELHTWMQDWIPFGSNFLDLVSTHGY